MNWCHVFGRKEKSTGVCDASLFANHVAERIVCYQMSTKMWPWRVSLARSKSNLCCVRWMRGAWNIFLVHCYHLFEWYNSKIAELMWPRLSKNNELEGKWTKLDSWSTVVRDLSTKTSCGLSALPSSGIFSSSFSISFPNFLFMVRQSGIFIIVVRSCLVPY